MKRFSSMALPAFIAIAACTMACEKDQPPSLNYSITGTAGSAQLVPPAGTGTAGASLSGTYNPLNHHFLFVCSWQDVPNDMVSFSFYNAPAGTNGEATGPPFLLTTAEINAQRFSRFMILSNAQGREITEGRWYFTFNTTQYPTGVIRGQLLAER